MKFYKTRTVHGVLEDDPDIRVEYCSKAIEHYETDPDRYLRIVMAWLVDTKSHVIKNNI